MPSRCAHTGDARSPRYARLGGLRSLVRASWRPSACFSMHAQERAPQHASLGALLGAFSQTYAFMHLVFLFQLIILFLVPTLSPAKVPPHPYIIKLKIFSCLSYPFGD